MCARLGMQPELQPEQVGPPASGLGAQRLALRQGGGRETTHCDEADDALGGCLLVGHIPLVPVPQENTGYSLEQTFVKGAIDPCHE
jgi:hypothetical protein